MAQHSRALNDHGEEKHQICFWRTRSNVEGDFIVYGSKGLWAIEVKNTKRVDSKDCKPLEAFNEDYLEAKLLLLD